MVGHSCFAHQHGISCYSAHPLLFHKDPPCWHAQRTMIPSLGAVGHMRGLAKRVIACLDVRANDAGDLVVTKGDQYDVRETDGAGREVSVPSQPSQLLLRLASA